MDRVPVPNSLIPALLGAAVTATIAIGSAAIGNAASSAERIATLEQVSRTTDARLVRIESKIDELVSRRP